jgi:GTPase
MKSTLKRKRILLVNLIAERTSQEVARRDATEMYELVQSLGDSDVIDMVFQVGSPDNPTYIGTGKSGEVTRLVQELSIDCVVLNAIVKPNQLYNLTKILYEANTHIEVWDRVDLILQIFARHAFTQEARLQIELAGMRHMGPRIYGMGHVLSRQGGTVGTRGIGETNTELMKRHWRREVKRVKDELSKLVKNRERQVMNRKDKGVITVSIVGYTNAGKTTLFNALTRKDKLEKNVLFATLDSVVGRLYLPGIHKEVLVSDTIGFIRDLPPDLIDAFTSTLMESIHADILLHVIDTQDPSMQEQIQTVEEILTTLKIETKKRIYVFNKSDLAKEVDRQNLLDIFGASTVFLSAKTGEGIEDLKKTIEQQLSD